MNKELEKIAGSIQGAREFMEIIEVSKIKNRRKAP